MRITPRAVVTATAAAASALEEDDDDNDDGDRLQYMLDAVTKLAQKLTV
jgi:hypothetical protein